MANIRTARRSGLVLRGGRNVRESRWLFITGTTATLPSSSTAIIINSLDAGALALTPFTIVRTRGFLHLKSDQTAAAEDQAVNLGYAVVSVQASAIGVTAVPTPTTDQGSDLWFVFQSLMAAVNAGAGDGQARGQGKDYDSRAMRKVEDGEDIVVVVESEVAGLTSGMIVRHTGRLLIKLH